MIAILITLIISGIILGLFFAAILAPLIMVGNKKRLKEMRTLVAEYRANPEQYTREEVMQKLIEIKEDISVLDKDSVEQARDILSLV